MKLGVNAQRTVMQAQLANKATLDKRMESLVHRRERDAGNLFANAVEHFFGAGMARERHQRLVDDCALMRDSQPVTTAELPELDLLLACVHIILMRRDREGFFFDNNYQS